MSAVDYSKLRASNPTRVTVPFAPWGGDVTIARLDPEDMLELHALAGEMPKGPNGRLGPKDAITFGVALLQKAIVDEDGSRPFGDEEGRLYLRREFGSLTPLLEEAIRLNRIGAQDAEADRAAAQKK